MNTLSENQMITQREVAVLASIVRNLGLEASPYQRVIISDLENQGIKAELAYITLLTLIKKGFILSSEDINRNKHYSLSEKGEEWLLENQDMFELGPNDHLVF